MEELSLILFLESDDDDIDMDSSSSSSYSSSDEDDQEAIILLNQHEKTSKSTLSTGRKTSAYIYINIPKFDDATFKSHFRMYPETFDYILRIIGPALQDTEYLPGRKPIPAKEQLLLAIWIMATPDSYRSVCEKLDIPKTTAKRAVNRVVYALYCQASRFIQWPKGERATDVINDFEKYSAFPGIIGAIDGTHIKLNVPKADRQSYVNRKGYTSIQMQAVCSQDLQFSSVFAGNTGSMHDARVFRLSPVANYLGQDDYFPPGTHLVGDAAYGIHVNIMVPYRDNGHLTAREKFFNFCLSSARVSIERAFGIWKTRWRRVRDCLPIVKLEKAPEFLLATCVLHNICIAKGDLIPYEYPLRVIRRGVLTAQETRNAGLQKRRNITMSLLMRTN